MSTKETMKSIILKCWEALAVRDGRKTQKRFVVKPQPLPAATEIRIEDVYGVDTLTYRAFPNAGTARHSIREAPYRPSETVFVRGHRGIKLEIVSVRCQRLHDITEEDAQAEGHSTVHTRRSYVDMFAAEWDEQHAKSGHGWRVNPWVWAVTWEGEIIKTHTIKPADRWGRYHVSEVEIGDIVSLRGNGSAGVLSLQDGRLTVEITDGSRPRVWTIFPTHEGWVPNIEKVLRPLPSLDTAARKT